MLANEWHLTTRGRRVSPLFYRVSAVTRPLKSTVCDALKEVPPNFWAFAGFRHVFEMSVGVSDVNEYTVME